MYKFLKNNKTKQFLNSCFSFVWAGRVSVWCSFYKNKYSLHIQNGFMSFENERHIFNYKPDSYATYDYFHIEDLFQSFIFVINGVLEFFPLHKTEVFEELFDFKRISCPKTDFCTEVRFFI